MSAPQSAIFTEGSSRFHFLEYRVDSEASPDALRHALRALLVPPAASAGVDPAPVNSLVAFGTALWNGLCPGGAPGQHDFEALHGSTGIHAPSTQRDVLVWLHGPEQGPLFDRARDATRKLADVATLELDQAAFMYHDSRDLTGFVDGSANPDADRRREVALVQTGPAAGGSFLLTQKWRHDLEKFHSRTVPEQEQIFGRSKADSVEFEGDALHPRSHVGRTDFKKDGVAMKMYRRSSPYSNGAEHGLMFLGFACSLERFDVLLARMFDQNDSDLLLQYTTPLSGAYWYAPSEAQLRSL